MTLTLILCLYTMRGEDTCTRLNGGFSRKIKGKEGEPIRRSGFGSTSLRRRHGTRTCLSPNPNVSVFAVVSRSDTVTKSLLSRLYFLILGTLTALGLSRGLNRYRGINQLGFKHEPVTSTCCSDGLPCDSAIRALFLDGSWATSHRRRD